MKVINNKVLAAIVIVLSAIQISLVSCNDDPGIESYYTQTREYASDFLKNREQFSDYVQILQRATGERGDLRLVDLLGTYGSYTVFAPTNNAIRQYLNSRGMISVDQLSKEDCDTLAMNSIIEKAFFTTDYSNGQFPKSNMLEHIMTIKSLQEWSETEKDSVLAMYVNQTSLITHADDSVGNGVVHTVGSIVSASNDLIGALIEKDTTCKVFNDALDKTNVRALLEAYIDTTYGWKTDKDRVDSCTWTNDNLCIHTAVEYDNVAYPEKRYYNFTVFMVQDKVLKEKYGIETWKDLDRKAHELYDPVYPEDANDTVYTSRRNALNRFISYHILDRYGSYYSLTANDGVGSDCKLRNNFNRRKWDIADWYETLMPHSLMKFSFPSGSKEGLYINRRGVQSRADERGVFVRGAEVYKPSQVTINQTAVNGIYHYIDDIVAYDQTTQEVVLNERIRLDCSTLSPDFMTKLTDGETARGHFTRTSHENGRYGDGGQGNIAANNKNTCIGFKGGYVRNFDYNDKTHVHVRMRVLGFYSYQGDEVTVKGRYDLNIKLPPVPKGTYEVRMFTCSGFASRGIMQAYIDGKPQGIPFDMRKHGSELFGNKTNEQLGNDPDAIAAFDKSIHNLGWMRGCGCYIPGDYSSPATGEPFRDKGDNVRKILGTFYTDGKSDHYLRLQQKMESEENEMNFDFIELCPSSVYNNEYFAEDQW